MANPTISVVLTDANNRPIANLTGLRWAWWDEPVVNAQTAPALSGTGASTDAAGLFSVTDLAGSTLTDGEVGWLEVTDCDGTISQAPVANVAAGPIAVSVAPVSYVGPLDIVGGAGAAYSVRALSADMLGEPLYTIREDAGDTAQTFDSDSETGDTPVAAITAFLDGANGFVTSWADQSGGGSDVVQATTARQPPWVASATNGRPAVEFGGELAEHFLATAGNVTLATGQFTVFLVVKNGSGSEFGVCGMNTTGSSGSSYVSVESRGAPADRIALDAYDGTNETGGRFFADETPIQDYAVMDIATVLDTASASVNGGATTQSSDFSDGDNVGSISERLAIGQSDAGSPFQWFEGRVLELIIWPTVISTEDRDAIRQNIADYYGITLGGGEELGGFTSGFDGGFA